jgi:hypothetical protein
LGVQSTDSRDAEREDTHPSALAARYLRAVRARDETEAADARERLAALDPDELPRLLPDDDHRIAFWANVYNATVQAVLRDDPDAFDRTRFFRRDVVAVAGRLLSLDDVEHGLLRRSKLGWGLGYFPRFFPGSFERANRVTTLDPRIHFALNCGAASCPPVAAYHPETLERDLEWVTEGYLETEVEYDRSAGVVSVPRLMLWYRGDFGGRRGIREFLRRYDVLPPGARPKIRYRAYDWSLSLGDYASR